jgi:hypothetical protein
MSVTLYLRSRANEVDELVEQWPGTAAPRAVFFDPGAALGPEQGRTRDLMNGVLGRWQRPQWQRFGPVEGLPVFKLHCPTTLLS